MALKVALAIYEKYNTSIEWDKRYREKKNAFEFYFF